MNSRLERDPNVFAREKSLIHKGEVVNEIDLKESSFEEGDLCKLSLLHTKT